MYLSVRPYEFYVVIKKLYRRKEDTGNIRQLINDWFIFPKFDEKDQSLNFWIVLFSKILI